jgi:hypothetical protein
VTSKEQKIFDIQCDSTKTLLLAQALRPVEEDVLYIGKIRNTKIAIEAQCVKEDGTVDLNVRELTQKEADFHNTVRRKAGERIEEKRQDKPAHTLTDEKRERAQTAFMARLTLGAIKERFKRLMQETFKPTYAEIVAEEMKKRNP